MTRVTSFTVCVWVLVLAFAKGVDNDCRWMKAALRVDNVCGDCGTLGANGDVSVSGWGRKIPVGSWLFFSVVFLVVTPFPLLDVDVGVGVG